MVSYATYINLSIVHCSKERIESPTYNLKNWQFLKYLPSVFLGKSDSVEGVA